MINMWQSSYQLKIYIIVFNLMYKKKYYTIKLISYAYYNTKNYYQTYSYNKLLGQNK